MECIMYDAKSISYCEGWDIMDLLVDYMEEYFCSIQDCYRKKKYFQFQ